MASRATRSPGPRRSPTSTTSMTRRSSRSCSPWEPCPSTTPARRPRGSTRGTSGLVVNGDLGWTPPAAVDGDQAAFVQQTGSIEPGIRPARRSLRRLVLGRRAQHGRAPDTACDDGRHGARDLHARDARVQPVLRTGRRAPLPPGQHTLSIDGHRPDHGRDGLRRPGVPDAVRRRRLRRPAAPAGSSQGRAARQPVGIRRQQSGSPRREPWACPCHRRGARRGTSAAAAPSRCPRSCPDRRLPRAVRR